MSLYCSRTFLRFQFHVLNAAVLSTLGGLWGKEKRQRFPPILSLLQVPGSALDTINNDLIRATPGIQEVFPFGGLLLYIYVKVLFKHLSSVLWGTYPGVELLGRRVTVRLTFRRTAKLFFRSGCTSLNSHQHCVRVPVSPHPQKHSLFSCFCFKYSHPSECAVGSQWGFDLHFPHDRWH